MGLRTARWYQSAAHGWRQQFGEADPFVAAREVGTVAEQPARVLDDFAGTLVVANAVGLVDADAVDDLAAENNERRH